MDIHIKSIPHSEQRYETVGDYWIDEQGVLQIRVSECGEGDTFPFLVAFHELIEWYLVTKKGISIEDIDDFDTKFEDLRRQFPSILGSQEPGMMASAPYRDEHIFATWMEKHMAERLGVNWDAYDSAIDLLENGKTSNPNK